MIQIRHITPTISIAILDLKAFSEENGITVKREQERLGTRLVLSNLLNAPAVELRYTKHKKPYLESHPGRISISHSHDKLVVILNATENTGIDIELIRDKILAIRHKFLNEQEALFAGKEIEKLISIWAAKEAMYKFHGLKKLDFRSNISVRDFDGTVIFGKIETNEMKKEFHLIRERIDNYILVYILSEI